MKFTNRYMLFYAMGIAAVVAVLLTVVATGLKGRQQSNIDNERKQMLLAAIGVDCDRNEAQNLYSRYFKQELTVESGNEELPLYLFEKEDSRGYVVPLSGKGLWGPIYANVALDESFNTIVGITFSHEGETPGLGAEIVSEEFCKRFIGKQIRGNDGRIVGVKVKKHADADNLHEVDALSGGTMTSNGVSEMLVDGLLKYQAFEYR